MGLIKIMLALVIAVNLTNCASYSPLSFGEIKELVSDLPRQNSFNYINAGTLEEDYFAAVHGTLGEPFIYIILSDTRSPISKIIAMFTGSTYNHASLAFDKKLATLVSYNGGGDSYNPGMNREQVEFLNQKAGASMVVYKIRADRTQKTAILRKIRQINREGSSYNLLGLITKRSYRPNIMFCSQFVYTLLERTDLDYFKKTSGTVKPMDFIELNDGSAEIWLHEIPVCDTAPGKKFSKNS